MRTTTFTALVAAALLAAPAAPVAAQQARQAQTTTLTADLVADISSAQEKFVALARAIPEDRYAWRPAEGVRSIGEVLLHVAADNYLIPAAIGFPADSATGIRGDDYKTAMAFEQRKLSKDATIQELERSFAHLKQSVNGTSPDRLGQQVSMFGMQFTTQRAWILATSHLHEHLGQLIAYARSNGVVPPWSRGESGGDE